MANSKAIRAYTAQRRTKAIALRMAGADWDTIADRLDYSSRAHACKDLTRALAANLAEMGRSVEELREVELMRLDRLQAALWAAAVGGDVRAVDSVLRIVDRRCKLLGLDAPLRAEVFTVDAIDAQIAELTAQHAGRAEAAETAGPAGVDG